MVAHYSTSVQFAVLARKPLLLITTDELNASGDGSIILAIAAELGKSVINIDYDYADIDLKSELRVDDEKYAEYQRKYIKMDGSAEKSTWDILIDHLERC